MVRWLLLCPKQRWWLLWLVYPFASMAQPAIPADSGQYVAPVPVRQHPQFNVYPLDYRSTFVRQSPVLALGGAAGFKFQGRHLITLGYYWLSQQKNRAVTNQVTGIHTLSDGLKLSYLNLAYTWSFIRSKHWEVGLPVEVGYGFSREAIDNETGRTLRTYNSHFVPLQLGITGDWKITRWAGLNVAVGYRVIPVKSTSRADFNGLYYNYGVNLYTGNILDDYRAWRKRKHELVSTAQPVPGKSRQGFSN